MTDRIRRLEIAIERLCSRLQRLEYPRHDTELELIKQYIRGDLEPKNTNNGVTKQ